jgi:AhpD family alkylhydroperoxidase
MRIEPVPVDQAMPVFDHARERFGWLPNTVRVMARGTNAAQQYLDSGARNAEGSVPPLARELIAVMVAESNGCDYCRTAHLLAARALRAHRNDPFIDAVVAIARCIHDRRGALTDAEVERAHAVGIDDRMLVDIAAVIAENTLGNLINNLARTEIDPVLVRALDKAVVR